MSPGKPGRSRAHGAAGETTSALNTSKPKPDKALYALYHTPRKLLNPKTPNPKPQTLNPKPYEP